MFLEKGDTPIKSIYKNLRIKYGAKKLAQANYERGVIQSRSKLYKKFLNENRPLAPIQINRGMLQEANELTALKGVLRIAAMNDINTIVFSRGDTVFPDVTFDTDVSSAAMSAKLGVVKYQGIQDAYIRSAGKFAKFLNTPIETVNIAEVSGLEADGNQLLSLFVNLNEGAQNNIITAFSQSNFQQSTDSIIPSSLLFEARLDKNDLLADPIIEQIDSEGHYIHEFEDGNKWILARDAIDAGVAIDGVVGYDRDQGPSQNQDDPKDYQIKDFTRLHFISGMRGVSDFGKFKDDLKLVSYLARIHQARTRANQQFGGIGQPEDRYKSIEEAYEIWIRGLSPEFINEVGVPAYTIEGYGKVPLFIDQFLPDGQIRDTGGAFGQTVEMEPEAITFSGVDSDGDAYEIPFKGEANPIGFVSPKAM